MSGAEERNAVRLMNLAIAMFSDGPMKVKAPLEAKMDAMRLVIDRASEILRTLHGQRMNDDARYARSVSGAELFRTQRLLRADSERRQSERHASAIKRTAHKRRMVAIGEAVVTLYDSIKVGGRPVGDLYYHELAELRKTSAFNAALLDGIIRHARPDAPTRVRDMIGLSSLAKLVERAREAAEFTPRPS